VRQGIALSWAGFVLLSAAVAGAAPQQQRYDVRTFGAVGNLKMVDTAAIQQTIDHCHASGGATVVLPARHEFLSGTLTLKSGVTLEVQKGVMLRGSRDLRDYRKTVPEIASYGVINYSDYALIQAINEKDVGIAGEGIIDGDGIAVPRQTGLAHLKTRPYILRFVRCEDVNVRQVMLRNPNFWTMVYGEDVVAARAWLLIGAPPPKASHRPLSPRPESARFAT
jgi:polygalacturonase